MAVPFNMPDEQEESPSSGQNQQNSAPVTPTSRPIPIPVQSGHSHPPVDNEMLVQAFYEALCRCSQISTPSTSAASSPSQSHFWFPHMHSPSQSQSSSPRNSFRSGHRRRLNSYGSQSQYSEDIAYEHDLSQWEQQQQQQREEMDEIAAQVPKTATSPKTDAGKKRSGKKDQKSGKITNLVISALQFVIDTLK